MNMEERRKALASVLASQKKPVSGSELAKTFNCSRQIIVGDIAFLKASGYDIVATNKGYIANSTPLYERIFKVRHTSHETKKELALIIDNGGIIEDVFVWHKVYGKIKANLNIFSHSGIEKFTEEIASGKSTELMHITDGYHYHTIKAASSDILDKIESKLRESNFIVPEI